MIIYWLRNTLILLVVYWPLASIAQALVQMDKTAPYYIRQWTMEDGLPQNSVQDILKSQSGYIWLATNGGLAKFDGIQFDVYDLNNSPNLISNRIAKITEDAAGKIWIALETTGISILENGQFIKFDEGGEFAGIRATCFQEDLNHEMWIGTTNGIIRTNGTAHHYYSDANGLENIHIDKIIMDQNGIIWAIGGIPGNKGWFLFRFNNDTFEVIDQSDQSLYSLFADDQQIWYATPQKIYQVDINTLEKTSRVNKKFNGFLKLMLDQQNNLWMGSQNGLFLVGDRHGDLSNPYTFNEPLNSVIKSIFQDDEGNIWVGTDGKGLVMLTKTPVTRYILPKKYNVKSFNQITSDGLGGFWVGSQCEGLVHYSDGKFRHFRLKTNCIGALYLDQNQRVLVATDHTIGTIDPSGRYEQVFVGPDETSGGIINAIYQDSSGDFWVGTMGDGVYQVRDSVISEYNTENGLSSNRIYNIQQRSNGDILVGTESGLSMITQNGSIQTITASSGLAPGAIRAIYEDENLNLWIGSYGGGLSRISADTIINYNTSNGLSENIVSRILEDDKGNLWMMGNFGLYFTTLKQLDAYAEGKVRQIQCISLGFKEGMAEGNGVGTAVQTADGTFWWPTIEGVANIDIAQFEYDTLTPQVVVRSFRVGNQVKSIGENNIIELSAKERDFEVSYNALSFNPQDKIQYQYQLKGYNDDWVDAGNRKVINFTNISPGEYELFIKASNNHGIWENKWTSVTVIVNPTIWQTLWVQLLIIGTGILMVIGIIRWRVAYLTKREKELETLVEERTKALLANKTELETALTSLEQTQRQLIESEKLASIGTLTSGLAHELNNPLGYIGGIAHPLRMDIEEIKAYIPEDRRDEFEEVLEEMNNLLNNLESGVQKASGIIKNLQNISPDGDTDQIIQFNLSEILGTTSLLLQKSNPSTTINQAIEQDAMIQANPIEINQLFQNIIQNSIEAIPEQNGVIDIELVKSNGVVNVSIKDNGPGISEEVMGHIFEPFFTTKRPGKGTGLGLFISYTIIKKYNGDIKVSSNKGNGAQFDISLPSVKS